MDNRSLETGKLMALKADKEGKRMGVPRKGMVLSLFFLFRLLWTLVLGNTLVRSGATFFRNVSFAFLLLIRPFSLRDGTKRGWNPSFRLVTRF